MMERERFEEVERLYHLALEREPGQRASFLESICGDDEGLLREVASLLAREVQAANFMEKPAHEVAAQGLAHSDLPSLVGRRLGPYDILGLLGAGGMGEVYRARDTRLNRIVAIKVLPSSLVRDLERRKRFEREARAISSLNHPHICTLHDVGQQDGVDFLVMEYLEGETLATCLKKGALPLDRVLRYAIEIADALSEAHRHGVLHRDLKPGNVMLVKGREGPRVKLLDFGLAKLKAAPSREGSVDLTASGEVLGTAQYMAPEQLRGEEADARTDIFALGAVIFEMATGRRAFEGKTRADLQAAILEHDPPLVSKVQPSAPAALDHVVKTCLVKDPEGRRQTAQDVLLEMKWIAEGDGNAGMPSPGRHKNQSRLAWAIASVVGLLAIVLAILHFGENPVETRAVRFSLFPPEKTSFDEPLAVSPDGTRLALIVSSPGKERSLWVRPLDSLAAVPLAGTEGAHDPFWSPDGRSIAFFAQGKLKKIDAAGGLNQTLCDAPHHHGGTWSRDGVILFGMDDVLYRVPAEGGPATQLTARDDVRFLTAYLFPHFLPDGQHFIYLHLDHRHENDGIYLGSLDSKASKRLIESHWMATYAPASDGRDGYLIFARDGSVMAQRFDPQRLELTGKPIPIAEGIESNADVIDTYLSVSTNGTLVYRPSGQQVISHTQLTWFDRAGKQLGTVGLPRDHHPALSPDGKRVAVMRYFKSGTNSNIWVLDLARDAASRLTFSSARDEKPVWSPDGRRIAFVSNREGRYGLYQKASSGEGEDELLLKSDEDTWTNNWSSDGRFLLYNTLTENADIWARPLIEGDRQPIPLVQTQFGEGGASLSGDGQWMAYGSNISGRSEVYVRLFRPGSGKGSQVPPESWLISTQGGGSPIWRRDGRELFYRTGGKIMAVEVKTGVSKGRPTFKAGVPKLLFDPRAVDYDDFAVTTDGQRFLINIPLLEDKARSVTVVLNWNVGLNP
jgi:serine/threonine protein kinase/Tol biopolymer transport system component